MPYVYVCEEVLVHEAAIRLAVTRIGRLLMRANLAIERHGGKIYTRSMFEQFGHILYECGAYKVEAIVLKHFSCLLECS